MNRETYQSTTEREVQRMAARLSALRRRIVPLSLGAGLLASLAFGAAWHVSATHAQGQTTSQSSQSSQSQSVCIGHHPQEYVWYTHSCTGHDEPELDPVSNRPGSARDITWTVVLPTDGAT